MKITSVSGTFLKYIDPLLEKLGRPDPESKEFADAITTGWTVWNAVVKNDVGGDPSFLLLAKEALPHPLSLLVEDLIARKRTQFGDDKFFIGVCEVRNKPDGSVTLYADAREV